MTNSSANENDLGYFILFIFVVVLISFYRKVYDYNGKEVSLRDWMIVKQLNQEFRYGDYDQVHYTEIQQMVKDRGLDSE